MANKDIRRYRITQDVVIKDYLWYLNKSDEDTKDRARSYTLTEEERKKILAYDKLGKRFCDYN